MNSRNLLNIVLALVLTGLVMLVIYEPGKDTPPPAAELTAIDQADIKSIVIEQPQQANIKLQKNNSGGWQMQEPLSISANNELIDNLLAVTNTVSHSSYPVSEVNLDEIQLSRPALKIQLNNTSFFFGTTDALRGYRYVLTGDRVHLITDRFTHLIRGNFTALVSPLLFPSHTNLSKLALPELTLELDNNSWSVQPEARITSADQIQKLVDEWRYARAMQVSLITDTGKTSESKKISTIEIYSTNKDFYQFELFTEMDEIILVRRDIGLRYHFDKQTGEKLLNFKDPEADPGKPI